MQDTHSGSETTGRRVLVADDNHFFRRTIEATLSEWKFEVVSTQDGEAALEILSGPDAPRLAILDWMMPKLDGPEVCRRIRALHRPEPPYILILTSKQRKQDLVEALESGADDFLPKPFDRAELKARLRVGSRIVGLQTSETVVFAFAKAVEAKSPYTQGHSARVMSLALALADRLDVSSSQRETLRKGALLHDIGKISMPDAILNKTGPLTAEELAIVQQHPADGVKIVEALESLRDTIPLIRWHHERLDGKGYPDGLRGDAIPPLVRILTVADVFDALASPRPYRPALSSEQCLSMMQKDTFNGAFDPAVVDALVTHLNGCSQLSMVG